MLSKILIANRGEIAVRVIRACRELGIATVAVYSDLDRDALHVRLADEAYALGGQTAAESYLNTEKILDVIERSRRRRRAPRLRVLLARTPTSPGPSPPGASPSSARRPRPSRSWATRSRRRIAAEEAGVAGRARHHRVPHRRPTRSSPSARSTAGRSPSRPPTAAAAGACGSCTSADEAAAALESAQSEALKGFGRGECYVERYLTWPRHVEMQVIADTHGNAVWVGERDCSAQRRHQKLIEESPAPGFPDEIRQAMGEAAVKVAKACGYVNAGTVEFLYQDGEFYFLEMNTRLQVEHPVTELVTGLDLVAEQIRVAVGRAAVVHPGRHRAAGPRHRGAASTPRTRPAAGSCPRPGRIAKLRRAAGLRRALGRRLRGRRRGQPVLRQPRRQAHRAGAPTATTAIARMIRALGEFEIEGIATTIPADLAILAPRRLRGRPSTRPSGSRTASTCRRSAAPPARGAGAEGDDAPSRRCGATSTSRSTASASR